MKKLLLAAALVVVVIVAIGINLSRASQEPLVTAPDLLQAGRQKLHAQLVQSEQREAEFEKQDWHSIPLLHDLVAAHQKRIAELSGNGEAGEIIAHDNEAIARLQKRIDELAATEAEKARAAAAQPSPHR
jgi:peptidoglycan hydrolase CwlO-like protein